MRSQVQVLAGPPAIPAGQSAAGREPGALAANLGRAGAARPSPPASPSALRPAHPGGRPPRPPPTVVATQPPTAATRQVRPPRAAASSRALAPPPATGAPHAGLACLVAQRARAAAVPNPARVRHRRLADQHASSAAPPPSRPAGPSTEPLTARQPTGTRPVPVVTGARRTDLGPNATAGSGTRRTRPDDGADTSRLDAGRVDTRRLDTGRADSRRPDRRTPGRRTQVTGHRTGWTPDGWTADPDDDTGWVDTRCWTPTGDRCYGWRPGSVDQGDDA